MLEAKKSHSAEALMGRLSLEKVHLRSAGDGLHDAENVGLLPCARSLRGVSILLSGASWRQFALAASSLMLNALLGGVATLPS